MAIYDEDPRPRVLLTGDSASAELTEVVEKYSGTVRVIPRNLKQIRWESWDAMVTLGVPGNWEDHLVVLQIGGQPVGRNWHSHYGLVDVGAVFSHGSEVESVDTLEGTLKDIVKSELIPLIREWPTPRLVLEVPSRSQEASYFEPLVSDLDGKAYAAIYRPDVGPREVIYLPNVVTDIRPWLLYAFERWSALNPESFPASPDWTNAEEWMTAEETDARATWVAACDAAEKARIEEERVESESLSALRELREKVDEAERVLLTGTADELVQAVRFALIRIGFEVEDQDALGAREKLEDLRVHDGEWIALCEVKGYTGGGKVSDLLKIGRFVERYIKETKGESPDARWYVVNQFRERDPSTRRQLLWGQDADVEGFAESDGLAIDTRSIFLLDKDVAGGVITSDEARRLLRESTGRFAYGL